MRIRAGVVSLHTLIGAVGVSAVIPGGVFAGTVIAVSIACEIWLRPLAEDWWDEQWDIDELQGWQLTA